MAVRTGNRTAIRYAVDNERQLEDRRPAVDHPPVIADAVDALDRAAAWRASSGQEMADVLSSAGFIFQSLTRMIATFAQEAEEHVTSAAGQAYTDVTIHVSTAHDRLSDAYDVFAREADFWLRGNT
jgi:hypothetical protein